MTENELTRMTEGDCPLCCKAATELTQLRKQLADLRGEVPIGVSPKTADGVPFAMGANLYYRHVSHKYPPSVVPCGVLEIIDPDNKHPEDYAEGERWRIGLRDTDGNQFNADNGSLYSTREAALTLAGKDHP